MELLLGQGVFRGGLVCHVVHPPVPVRGDLGGVEVEVAVGGVRGLRVELHPPVASHKVTKTTAVHTTQGYCKYVIVEHYIEGDTFFHKTAVF